MLGCPLREGVLEAGPHWTRGRKLQAASAVFCPREVTRGVYCADVPRSGSGIFLCLCDVLFMFLL